MTNMESAGDNTATGSDSGTNSPAKARGDSTASGSSSLWGGAPCSSTGSDGSSPHTKNAGSAEVNEAKLLGELESIQVLVRVRPLLGSEVERNAESVVDVKEGPKGQGIVTLRASSRRSIRCKYDYAFTPEANQQDIYTHVADCAARVMEGYNSTICAYGQTGSGKTHTMFGSSGYMEQVSTRRGLPEAAGVIPRAIWDIFQAIRQRKGKDTTVYCSFVQVYNEQLFDMLRDGGRGNPLAIHEDKDHDIYVQGLSEFMVKTIDECMALLRIGEENRAIRETSMNQASSRSHSLFQLVIEQRRVHDDEEGMPNKILRSKLNLVDLAGSEKWDTRGDMVSQHACELTSINLSLFTLGRCIAALSAKAPAAHIPYRESKLTRLLQDSLGGNCRTRIIATLSPTSEWMEESLSTLKFADRAKQVMMYVRPNEKSEVDHVMFERMVKEVTQLRALVLKLKEDQAANSGASLRYPAMTVDQAMEKAETFEAELKKERAEVSRLRTQNSALQLALTSATAIAYEKKKEEERRAAEDGSLSKQNTGRLSPSNKTLEIVSNNGVDEPQATSQRDTNGNSAADNNAVRARLEARLSEVEGLFAHMTSLLSKFFAFEIEEADLRNALSPYIPNVDRLIATPVAAKRPGRDAHAHAHSGKTECSPVAHSTGTSPCTGRGGGAHVEKAAAAMRLPAICVSGGGAKGANQSGHQGPLSRDEEDEEDGYGFEGMEAVLPKLHAEGVANVAYRIRGHHKHEEASKEFKDVICTTHEEEEQRLVQQLKEARKRMRKHMKLQEWLVKKEQKELEAAERQEEERRASEQAKKESDAKFRERARRQKKKLEMYYAGLRKKAATDLYGSDGGDDVGGVEESDLMDLVNKKIERYARDYYNEPDLEDAGDAGSRQSHVVDEDDDLLMRVPTTLPEQLADPTS